MQSGAPFGAIVHLVLPATTVVLRILPTASAACFALSAPAFATSDASWPRLSTSRFMPCQADCQFEVCRSHQATMPPKKPVCSWAAGGETVARGACCAAATPAVAASASAHNAARAREDRLE